MTYSRWICAPLKKTVIITILTMAFAQITSASRLSSGIDPMKAHVTCEKVLARMINAGGPLLKAIRKDDLDFVRVNLEKLEKGIIMARNNMDAALLQGKWSTPSIKQEGHFLFDRLETLRTLNFIALAFTSSYYDNPTGKVSASVKDSVNRFFNELETLHARVKKTNSKV